MRGRTVRISGWPATLCLLLVAVKLLTDAAFPWWVVALPLIPQIFVLGLVFVLAFLVSITKGLHDRR